jgi:hypothetical protein
MSSDPSVKETTAEPAENTSEAAENTAEAAENASETAETAAEAARERVVAMLAQASIDGERFYREFLWVRVLLWRMLKYRPEDFTDDEKWESQMESKLPPRDIHCMYAVLVLWDKANKDIFDGDPKAKVYSLFRTISFKKDIFAAALHMAEDVLGIYVSPDDLKYDGDLMNALRTHLQSLEFNRRMDMIRQKQS